MVQLFDWDGDRVVDAAVLSRAQEHADSQIDAYARRRFATPIANPTATLRAFAAALVVHHTRKLRGLITDVDAIEIEKAQLLWLERLASGQISPSDPEPQETPNVSVTIVPNAGPFSRCEIGKLF